MNNLDKSYQALLQDILDNGVEKQDRTGTGTISVFGRQIRHKMSEGYPLLTTKKMAFKTMVTELLWFLRGDTNIKYLVDNGCHIWDGDAYKNYEKWFWDNIPPKADTSGKLTQEEFINKCKTYPELKWGLKIEERELSWEERRDLLTPEQYDGTALNKYGHKDCGFGYISPFTDKVIPYWMNLHNIPTKQITLTYNDKTIESYE